MSRLVVAATLLFALAWASCDRNREDPMVLRAKLQPAVSAAQTWSFTVKGNGPHDVALEFPSPVKDEYISTVLERGIASVGDKEKLPPEFAFTWQILEGPKEVAAGAGHNGVRSSGNNHTLIFGSFPAQAGPTYRLRVVLSSPFMSLLRGEPSMIIQPAATSP